MQRRSTRILIIIIVAAIVAIGFTLVFFNQLQVTQDEFNATVDSRIRQAMTQQGIEATGEARMRVILTEQAFDTTLEARIEQALTQEGRNATLEARVNTLLTEQADLNATQDARFAVLVTQERINQTLEARIGIAESGIRGTIEAQEPRFLTQIAALYPSGTPSNTPTMTQTPTITPTPTITFTPSPTDTPEPTITYTPSMTPTATPSRTPVVELEEGRVQATSLRLIGYQAVWSPVDDVILTADITDQVLLYDLADNTLTVLGELTASVRSLAWSGDGRYALAADQRGQIGVWDTRQGNPLHMAQHNQTVVGVGWSDDSETFFTLSRESLRAWHRDSGDIVAEYPVNGARMMHVAYQHIAYVDRDGLTLLIWVPEAQQFVAPMIPMTQVPLANPPETMLPENIIENAVQTPPDNALPMMRSIVPQAIDGDMIEALAWSVDGALIALPNTPDQLGIWDFASGELMYTINYDGMAIVALDWSHDGRYLAGAFADRTVRVWQVATGELVAQLTLESNLFDVDWSPDDGRLALVLIGLATWALPVGG